MDQSELLKLSVKCEWSCVLPCWTLSVLHCETHSSCFTVPGQTNKHREFGELTVSSMVCSLCFFMTHGRLLGHFLFNQVKKNTEIMISLRRVT